jgi:hypothetical protein
MKNIVKIIIILLIGLFLIGCEPDTTPTIKDTDVKQQKSQEKILSESDRQTGGMPNIKNFTEKKLLKQILELRDVADLKTYLYNQNLDGKYIYIGQCIGFGMPYSTQYTNPSKMNTVDGGEYNAVNPYVINQADPNGLFTTAGQRATWINFVNETTGKSEIIEMEPDAIVTQSKLPKRLCAEWSLPSNY